MFKAIALIPARSGSKRVKDKNILKINGHPLLAYTISLALKSKIFDRVICVTDSQQYKKIAQKYGAEVPKLRPKKFSNDDKMVSSTTQKKKIGKPAGASVISALQLTADEDERPKNSPAGLLPSQHETIERAHIAAGAWQGLFRGKLSKKKHINSSKLDQAFRSTRKNLIRFDFRPQASGLVSFSSASLCFQLFTAIPLFGRFWPPSTPRPPINAAYFPCVYFRSPAAP